MINSKKYGTAGNDKRFSAAPYHAVPFLFNNRKFHDYLCIGLLPRRMAHCFVPIVRKGNIAHPRRNPHHIVFSACVGRLIIVTVIFPVLF